MSVYVQYLPQVFPWVIDVDRETAEQAALACLKAKNPSSFAVTSDTGGSGRSRLWMSDVSRAMLRNEGIIP